MRPRSASAPCRFSQVEHTGDLAVGVENVVALARQLGGRAGEGVLRLQLEDAEGAGLAIEDGGVDIGANVTTVSPQLDPAGTGHEPLVPEERVEILAEDHLTEMSRVVILLRGASFELAGQEEQRLRCQPVDRPGEPVRGDPHERRRRDAGHGGVKGRALMIEREGGHRLADDSGIDGQGRSKCCYQRDLGSRLRRFPAIVRLERPTDEPTQDVAIGLDGAAADDSVRWIAELIRHHLQVHAG